MRNFNKLNILFSFFIGYNQGSLTICFNLIKESVWNLFVFVFFLHNSQCVQMSLKLPVIVDKWSVNSLEMACEQIV